MTAITELTFNDFRITCYLNEDGNGILRSSQINGSFVKQYTGNKYELIKKTPTPLVSPTGTQESITASL